MKEPDVTPLLADADADEARQEQPFAPALPHPHVVPGDEVLEALQSSRHGLSRQEAMARLERFGRNTLPRPTPPGIITLFLRQFLSPLIYILLIAAVVSVALQDRSGPTPSSFSPCC